MAAAPNASFTSSALVLSPSTAVRSVIEPTGTGTRIDVPLSLPSRMVEQRPDVRAAEANLHSAGALVGMLEAFEQAPWPVHIVYAERKPMPLKIRAFLNWVTPRLKARLA